MDMYNHSCPLRYYFNTTKILLWCYFDATMTSDRVNISHQSSKLMAIRITRRCTIVNVYLDTTSILLKHYFEYRGDLNGAVNTTIAQHWTLFKSHLELQLWKWLENATNGLYLTSTFSSFLAHFHVIDSRLIRSHWMSGSAANCSNAVETTFRWTINDNDARDHFHLINPSSYSIISMISRHITPRSYSQLT